MKLNQISVNEISSFISLMEILDVDVALRFRFSSRQRVRKIRKKENI